MGGELWTELWGNEMRKIEVEGSSVVGFVAPGNARYAWSLAQEQRLAMGGYCRTVEIVIDMHVYTRLLPKSSTPPRTARTSRFQGIR